MNKALNVLLLITITFRTCYATTWGSLTQVSVEPEITVAGTNNSMIGFGWFRNGFLFQDSSTSCTFSSVFPVAGSINLKQQF